jgi:predicted phage terminase large subunit-like protein
MALPFEFGLKKTRFTQKDFLKGLEEFASELRTAIEAGVEGFDDDPAASLARRNRVIDGDFEYFCQTYFPHYVKGQPSEMHEHVFVRLPELLAEPASAHEWLEAPRGEAKSTIVTQLGVLYATVTGLKHFIPIIMATADLSVMMLEAIKAELEFNPRLNMDFREHCGKGRVWQSSVVITAGDVKLMAIGAGKKLRGMRHGPYRPDLVVLDDMENDENVRSAEQRDKLEQWINRAVIPLGPPGGKMDIIYVGTLLHWDAVLARISRNPMWTGRRFQSIKRWPDRMDHWDKWEERLRNEGTAAADLYYAEHREAMNAGAEVSWPSVRPIEYLMKLRVLIGVEAFDSEQQNDPINAGAALFGKVTFWVKTLSSWIFYGSCDPSMGKQSRRSDPSALLVGGFNRDTGVLDIVEAAIRKRLPDLIIEDVIAFQREYNCRAWGVETVQFQEFFATEMVKRSAKAGVPVPVVPIKSSTDKGLRIEALQPHVANGLIRFSPKLITLLDQLRHYGPDADHDDGPDALEMLWTLIQKRTAALAGGFRSTGQRTPGEMLRGYGVERYGRGGFGGPNG